MGYDIMISIFLGILYNMFFHKFANFYYKDMGFDSKYKHTVIMLFVGGLLGIVIGKLYLEKYVDNKISDGIVLGGIFLVISAMMNNWTYMTELTKIGLIVFTMGGLMHYSSHTGKKRKLTEHKRKVKIV